MKRDPEVLLADEPTGNLDQGTSHNIMAIFRSLNAHRHLTTIMITHDPEMAAYARRQVELRDGCVISDQMTQPAQAPPGEAS